MTDDAVTPTPKPEGEEPAPPASAFDPDPADTSPGGPAATSADRPAGTSSVLVADPATDPAGRGPRGGGGRGAGNDDGGAGPIGTDFPHAPTKGGLTAALVSVGAGLLAAAVVIATVRGRDGDKLHWSSYSLGLVATAILLLLAVIGAGSVRRRSGGQARGDLVTWPGVVGILATAPMILLGIGPRHDGEWEAYLIGGVITVLALIGYVVARRPAFVVTAILGLGILYTKVFSDTVSDSFDHDNTIVVVAGAVTAFVVIITLLGWFLPSRAITGVVVGVVGLVGVGGAMIALLIEREVAKLLGPFASMFSSFTDSGSMSDVAPDPSGSLGGLSANPADYTNEVAWIIVFAAILTLLWALAALVSDHAGFKVLAIALPAVVVPAGTAVILVRHPAWWEGGLTAGGAVLVLAAYLLARRKARIAEGM